MENIILSLFPTPDRLLEATEIELDRALLRYVAAATDDPMRAVGITRDGAVISLFERVGTTVLTERRLKSKRSWVEHGKDSKIQT